MTIIILDSFSLIHRVYHALPALTDLNGNPTGAVYGFCSILIKLFREQRPDCIYAAFDTKGPTFREHEFEAYHTNRPEMADDFRSQIEPIKEFLRTWDIPVLAASGFEGDDIIGTLVSRLRGQSDARIRIVTADRDSLQLVSDNVTAMIMRKGITDIVEYDERTAKAYLGFHQQFVPDYKALAGDASDNFPGVRGIGPKTAQALVQKFGTIEKMYAYLDSTDAQAYEKPVTKAVAEKLLIGRATALQAKYLATIRADAPIDIGGAACAAKTQPTQATKEFLIKRGFVSLLKRLDAASQGTLL